MSAYYRRRRRSCPAGHHRGVVAAVLSRHRFDTWELSSRSWGDSAPCSRARRRFCSDRPGGCNCWRATVTHLRQRRTLLSNWRHAKHQTTTWPGLTSGACATSSMVPNAYNPATLQRFAERFARFNLHRQGVTALIWARGSHAVRGDPRQRVNHREPYHFESEKLTAGHAKRCASGDGTPLVSYGLPQSPIVRIVDPDTSIECPAGTVGEIWVHGDNVAAGYWQKPARDRTHLRRNACRSVGRHTRRAMAANRRFGLLLRWRDVHHRPYQGSPDRLWAQPLSRRHRGDDPGDHPRPLRGDSGSRR